METIVETPVRTFVSASEVWVPEDGKLVFSVGSYGELSDFEQASREESFAKTEGLPGKAWDLARPVVLKDLSDPLFKRAAAARQAGLTSAVAIPVFAGDTLKAVLVVLCSDDAERMGAIELWAEKNGLMVLEDGYYGAAKHFEWVSQHTHFPKGEGLPGGVWASSTPMLFRDLGAGYRFVRADSAGRAGLTTGLGLPVETPSGDAIVLTLLSARGTPIARRFEIWDARPAVVGSAGKAVLADGVCERDGPLWDEDKPREVFAYRGLIGRAIGEGLPAVSSAPADTAGYASAVCFPIYRGGELSHVVAWYC